MSSRTRVRLTIGLVLGLITLPAEALLLPIARTPDAAVAAREWADDLSTEERQSASLQIDAYPQVYRRAIMRELDPRDRADAWRGVLRRYLNTERQLTRDQVRVVQEAMELLSDETFTPPVARTSQARIRAVFDDAVAVLGPATAKRALRDARPQGRPRTQPAAAAAAIWPTTCAPGASSPPNCRTATATSTSTRATSAGIRGCSARSSTPATSIWTGRCAGRSGRGRARAGARSSGSRTAWIDVMTTRADALLRRLVDWSSAPACVITLVATLGVVAWPRVTHALGIEAQARHDAVRLPAVTIDAPADWYASRPRTLDRLRASELRRVPEGAAVLSAARRVRRRPRGGRGGWRRRRARSGRASLPALMGINDTRVQDWRRPGCASGPRRRWCSSIGRAGFSPPGKASGRRKSRTRLRESSTRDSDDRRFRGSEVPRFRVRRSVRGTSAKTAEPRNPGPRNPGTSSPADRLSLRAGSSSHVLSGAK